MSATDTPGNGNEVPRNRWYVNNPAALADILRSAKIARTNSGQPQFVHHHPSGEPCVDACSFVAGNGRGVPS